MKRPDDKPDSELLFDLPLEPRPSEPPTEGRAAEAAPAKAALGDVQTPLVFDPPEPHEIREPAPPAFSTGRAGEPPIGTRFLAAALDLGALAAGLAAALGGMGLLGIRPTLALWPPLAVFLLCFSFLYTVVPLTFWGKTPGMAYAGILCRGTDGLPLTIPQAILRWAGVIITYAGVGLPALLTLSGVSLSDLLSRARVGVDGMHAGDSEG